VNLRRRASGARRRLRAAGRALLAYDQKPPSRAERAAQRDFSDVQSMRRLLAFSLRSDENCVDIGAHRGSVLSEMLRVAPAGHHIAFEPIPELAELLRSEFPFVEVHQAALSNAPGQSEFAHVRGTAEGWSGLRFRPLPGGQAAEVENIVVPVEVLDQVLDPVYRPAVIKIDVEGAEEQVFRGSLETLRRHQPVVIFEHGLGSADVFGTTPGAIHTLLDDQVGYRIFDLDGNGPYSLNQFEECFYSRARVNFVAHP
jgi:FkbM family methyltransferase